VIVYWLLKSAVAAVRVTFTVPVPVKVPKPEMTSAAPGVKVAELPTVKVPPTAKLEEEVTAAELAKVRLLKVRVPLLAIDEPLPMVIVPADGLKLTPVPTVKAPFTVKLDEVVATWELEKVKPLKARVPELVIILELPTPVPMVIVPADALKLAEVPTVKFPYTVKSDALVTVAELAMAKL